MKDSHNLNWDQLVEFVPQVMEKRGVPGVVLGVFHEGETRSAGFGVTNTDHPLPVTDETFFQTGSITKTFTATAIMRLVETGKLELDATVRTYVPSFKVGDETASSQATIRHLLTHTGGWFGDFFQDTGPGENALPRYVAEMAGLEQLAPLGETWSYNNAGFSLAGYGIEVVTGKRYEDALAELVLEPLGLENTFFDPGDVMTHRFAVGHDVGDSGAEVARPWPLPRSAYPAGGVICIVNDLLCYARFHLGDGAAEDGTRLLTPESMSLMQTTLAAVWKNETFGLPWFLKGVDGTALVYHGGGTTGQVSQLTLVPERGLAVAVFTNANQGGTVTTDVTDWVMKHYLEVEIPRPEPMGASEADLAPYVGRYSNPFTDIELGMLSGKLVAQVVFKRGFPDEDTPAPPAPPPASLDLCEEDRLLVLNGPSKDRTIDVLRNPDGSIGWLRFGGRINKRQE